jgi:hypothetical protein
MCPYLISLGHICLEEAGIIRGTPPALEMMICFFFMTPHQNHPSTGLQESPRHFAAEYSGSSNYYSDPVFKIKKRLIIFAWILPFQFDLLI